MSEDERLLLNLFDSYWFEYEVFAAKPKPYFSTGVDESSPVPPEAVVQVIGEDELSEKVPIIRKSFSDQFLCAKNCSDYRSSDSGFSPKLQTVVSGMEVGDFHQESNLRKEFLDFDILNEIKSNTNRSSVYQSHTDEGIVSRGRSMKGRRKKKNYRKGISGKSLTELEFEELKGFMDLGFVFSDEDKDSRLVSIIPGLQRFGKNGEQLSDQGFGELQQVYSVPRPYLSEAWGDLEAQKRYRNPLMDLRIPDFGNEKELKDHLRFWAHTVGSTVK